MAEGETAVHASRPALALAVYSIAVIVLGALVAPWLYWFVQALAENVESFRWLQHHPFKRVFNRSLMIVALAGLWPLLKHVGIRSAAEMGFVRSRAWLRQFLLGYFCGIISVALAIGVSVAFGRREFGGDFAAADIAGFALKFFVVGLVVAVIEETFFRGGVQRTLQKGIGAPIALVLASVIYSALHFLKPRGVRILPDEVTVWSGFECMAAIFSRSFSTEGVAVGFVSLWLAGMILGWVFLRTRALYIPIGLHAGWVLVNELARELGAGSIIEDWITWPALLLLWLVLWKIVPRRLT